MGSWQLGMTSHIMIWLRKHRWWLTSDVICGLLVRSIISFGLTRPITERLTLGLPIKKRFANLHKRKGKRLGKCSLDVSSQV